MPQFHDPGGISTFTASCPSARIAEPWRRASPAIERIARLYFTRSPFSVYWYPEFHFGPPDPIQYRPKRHPLVLRSAFSRSSAISSEAISNVRQEAVEADGFLLPKAEGFLPISTSVPSGRRLLVPGLVPRPARPCPLRAALALSDRFSTADSARRSPPSPTFRREVRVAVRTFMKSQGAETGSLRRGFWRYHNDYAYHEIDSRRRRPISRARS